MAFVRQWGSVLIRKARRAKALRGRPDWQTEIPDTAEGRATYRIAAKYEERFADDFLDAVKNTFDDASKRKFVEAYRSGSEVDAMRSLPIFSDDPENEVWKKFTERLQSDYLMVIQESGEDEAKRLKREFGVDMGFSIAKALAEFVQKSETPFKHVGLFIRLPDDLAKQFPRGGRGDDESPPHLTLLYYGDADPVGVEKFGDAVRPVLLSSPSMRLRLGPVASFKNQDGQTVRHCPVYGKGLQRLFDALKKALAVAGDGWKPTYSSFKPHVTLEYVEPGEEPRISSSPKGEWIAEACELWGGGKVVQYPFIEGSIAKAEKTKVKVVPVNPYSIKWVEERSLSLVKQGISDQQREVVRTVIQEGFNEGLRAENVYDAIRQNIGLTDREVGAVINRERLLASSGDYSPTEVRQITSAYREQLLKKRAARIARTETIQAQAQGREEVWRLASDQNLLPEVERVWIAAPNSCEYCAEMDGLTAPVDGTYESPTFGPIEGPTLHPHCGCSETLQRKGG